MVVEVGESSLRSSNVGTLYYKVKDDVLNRIILGKLKNFPSQTGLTVLSDLTARFSANPKKGLMYRFAPAPNLVTLLFVGENGN